jgi:Predicted integral membrane protein (DUF2269)
MTTIAVTFYDVVVWLHISSVVLAFGPTFAFGIYATLAQRKYPRALPAILDGGVLVLRTLTTIGGVLILATGLYLALDRWDLGYFFVTWGMLAIVVLLGMAHGFFIPNDLRTKESAERDIDAAGPTGEVKFSDATNALGMRSARLGPIAGIIVILTIYVMAAKPFTF